MTHPLIPESIVDLYRRAAKAFRAPSSPRALAIAELLRAVEVHHGAAASLREAARQTAHPTRHAHRLELANRLTDLAGSIGDLAVDLGGAPPSPNGAKADLPWRLRDIARAPDDDVLQQAIADNLAFTASVQHDVLTCPHIPLSMRQRVHTLIYAGDGLSADPEQDKIDESLRESFPASDPPAWTLGCD